MKHVRAFTRLFLGVALLSAALGCAATTPQHTHKFASKGDTTETDLLGLQLNATPIANLADNAAASPFTNLYLAFHTADPGEAGAPTTSEATFPGYTRTAIPRSSGSPAWTLSSPAGVGTAKNTNAITGPTYTCGAGSPQTLTHFSIDTTSSGAGKLLYSGALTNQLIVNPCITITVAANGLTITED